MKKNRFFAGAALLGIVALAMTGCAKVPQEKIDAANMAVEETANAGAAMYATSSFNELQDSLFAALANVEEQNAKFFKNFDMSIVMLDGVVAFADEVKLETETSKETLRAEIAMTISEIRVLLEENKQLITEAPKGKEGTAALVAINSELMTIETTITETEQLLNAGELMTSKERAIAAKEKAVSINDELKTVITKYKTARG